MKNESLGCLLLLAPLSLTNGCSSAPAVGESRPALVAPSPEEMLSGGGCYWSSCREGRTNLVLPCVWSGLSIDPPLRLHVRWANGVDQGENSFEFRGIIRAKPTPVAMRLQLACEERNYRVELSAVADQQKVHDVVQSPCAELPSRCDR